MRKSDTQELAWAALDLLPQAVLLCRADGEVLFRNRAADHSLPAGQQVSAVLKGGEDGGVDFASDAAALPLEPVGVVHHNVSLAGSGGRRLLADVHLRLLPPTTEVEGPCVLVVVEDVSLRASAERRLVVGERLAAGAKAAARTAHEMNNPLDGVLRYLGLAGRLLAEGRTDAAGEHLAKARDGVQRMVTIVRAMLDESGGPRETLGRLLDEAVAAFAPRSQATGVTVAVDLGEAGEIGLDGRLFQVFCNIIKNALDAMPAGGVLTIRATVADGQCAVEFADSGYGLSEPQLKRLFEPFYTTKPAGEGMGLGLVISREIVSSLGGSISARRGEAAGAVITVTLPIGEQGG